MRVVKVMNGAAGRSARVLAGLALIAGGIAAGGTGGVVLALIGVVPLAAGAAGACLAAPLLRAPLRARLAAAADDHAGDGPERDAGSRGGDAPARAAAAGLAAGAGGRCPPRRRDLRARRDSRPLHGGRHRGARAVLHPRRGFHAEREPRRATPGARPGTPPGRRRARGRHRDPARLPPTGISRRYRRASCPAMSPAWLRATAQKACWSSTTPASPATLTTRPQRARPCMRREPALRRCWPGHCRTPSLTCCARRPARPSRASRPAASTCASGWTGPGSAAPPSCTPARSPRPPSCGGGCNCKATASTCAGCCHPEGHGRRRPEQSHGPHQRAAAGPGLGTQRVRPGVHEPSGFTGRQSARQTSAAMQSSPRTRT